MAPAPARPLNAHAVPGAVADQPAGAPAGTWGPQAEWGEHEMDYILFIRADVTLAPNPEEVMVSSEIILYELFIYILRKEKF